MSELVSVIIPVYNVERYLNRCVESVVNQTYANLEIILVDDGSTDNCSIMCDEWAVKDNRIKVIHKKNGGLSSARNAAIEVFKGDYITFVDSDDYVSPYYVSNLLTALRQTDSDMAISQFAEVWETNEDKMSVANEDISSLRVVSARDCFEHLLYQNGVETTAWGKLYKCNDFHDVRYPEGKLYEDLATTYKLIHRCKRIAIINNADYYYLQRNSSIQNCKFNLKKLDAIDSAKELFEFIEKEYPDLIKAAVCRSLSVTCNIYFQIKEKEFKSIKNALWRDIKKYRRIVLFDKKARKKARIAAAASYFGKCIFCLGYKITKKNK